MVVPTWPNVQASAAKLNPPHLSTIILTVGGTSNGWNHAILNHGAFCQKQLTWAFSNLAKETSDSVVKKMMKSEYVGDWFQALPLKRGLNPLSANPEIEDYIFEMLEHPSYDNYWKQMGVNWMEYYPQTADIPMIHVSGWYDNYCQTAIDNYMGLSTIKKIAGKINARALDAWHFRQIVFGRCRFRDCIHHARLQPRLASALVRSFPERLKNGVESDPAVKVFVMGTGDGHKDASGRLFHGGYWVTSSKWPLPGTQYINYYLHENGLLSPAMPDKNEKSVSYIYDPENRYLPSEEPWHLQSHYGLAEHTTNVKTL
ncbi:MAG: CocE/NonD family hydrolase [Bacteroidales bacterium]|nr:CocE/NonD family hydrolase [Bacteroidales bacterium]